MNEQNIVRLKALLNGASNIVITTHIQPDGDAIGSSLALYRHLATRGFNVTVITPTTYPDFLQWLPGNETVLVHEGNEKQSASLINKCDLIFLLDFNDPGRLKTLGRAIESSNAAKILIDHHPRPAITPDLDLHDTSAPATAELLFDILCALDGSDGISRDSAICLYTGIMCDTLSFRIASTTPNTHKIAAELLKQNIDHDLIYARVFNSFSQDRFRLLGYALNNKLLVLPEYRTAILSLDASELHRFGHRQGDTEGFVNYGLSISGVVLSAFIMERPDEVRVSLRSRGAFPASEITGMYFNGGGHINAAGGSFEGSVEACVDVLKSLLPKYQNQLQSVPI